MVLRIPSGSRTEALPSNGLVSYPTHLLVVGSYPSTEMQLMYSMAPTDWDAFVVAAINLGTLGSSLL